jgi:glyoxylase-like metal-dependent hydrolase (beta-lactamase superfamily II)
VIDPGYDGDEITGAIKERGLSVSGVLATHAHFDHIASVSAVQAACGAPPFYVHAGDAKILKTANVYTTFLNSGKFEVPAASLGLSDGEVLALGGRSLKVIHAPGHTPGGCVFEAGGALFTGDLLIKTSEELRRLPGFDAALLESSRRRVLDGFPPASRVFPGHGKETSLGELRSRFS